MEYTENLDCISLSVKNLQKFLDVFYEDHVNKRKLLKKCPRYRYHNGNNVRKIKSIRLKTCLVSYNKNYNNKSSMVVIRYFNNDNILCCFNILLETLQEFELHASNSPYRKILKLPII